MKKKIWIAITAIFIIGVSIILYTQSKPSPRTGSQDGAVGNTIQFQVTREDLSYAIEVKGKSSYVKESLIYAPFSADVREWQVEDGKRVVKGEPLFRLDGASLTGEITRLRASLQKQELEAKLRKIQDADSSSGGDRIGETDKEAIELYAQMESRKLQNELDQITSNLSKIELSEMEKKLGNALFTAPEDGIFLYQSSSPPNIVRENELLGKIVDLSQMQLVCIVDEYDVFHIREGLPVDVRVNAMNRTALKGTVTKVSKFAKPETEQSSASAQFEVIVSLEANDNLVAGLSLTGTIETEKRENTLVVPSLVIYKEKDESYVLVPSGDGQNAERKTVVLGMETADKTEILEGLNEGDTVLLQ